VNGVEKIADALLYEGYVLWPYRRSATKNQRRWTLGGVYPRAYSEACGESDPWLMQTQCLVLGPAPALQVRVRFLHVVERRVGRRNTDGTLEYVDSLQVGGECHLAWDEATEREVWVEGLRVADLVVPRCVEIRVPAGSEMEPLTAPGGESVGVLVRSWQALTGVVEIGAEAVGAGVSRVTVRITNTAPWSGGADREGALRHTFVATHTILSVEGGEFVSLTDPPEALKAAAGACENVKTWPVLVGEEEDGRALLSSPIILSDYPRVAPESPGDLFDGSEIDQLLVLNVLTLTDEEKGEMRASDSRAREILERTEALTPDDFWRLHGTIREFRVLGEQTEANPFASFEPPVPASVVVGGVEIAKGSRVRLRPRAGGDIFDLALAGKVGIVEAIEQDYDDRVHLSVTVEDDPGRELGEARVLGHRFFFFPEEVEPLPVAGRGDVGP
jgi:hypothetical protein